MAWSTEFKELEPGDYAWVRVKRTSKAGNVMVDPKYIYGHELNLGRPDRVEYDDDGSLSSDFKGKFIFIELTGKKSPSSGNIVPEQEWPDEVTGRAYQEAPDTGRRDPDSTKRPKIPPASTSSSKKSQRHQTKKAVANPWRDHRRGSQNDLINK